MTSPSPVLSWTHLLQRTATSQLHNASAWKQKKKKKLIKKNVVEKIKIRQLFFVPFVFCRCQSVWAVSWRSGWAPLFAFVTLCFQRADFLCSDAPYSTRPCHKVSGKLDIKLSQIAKQNFYARKIFNTPWSVGCYLLTHSLNTQGCILVYLVYLLHPIQLSLELLHLLQGSVQTNICAAVLRGRLFVGPLQIFYFLRRKKQRRQILVFETIRAHPFKKSSLTLAFPRPWSKLRLATEGVHIFVLTDWLKPCASRFVLAAQLSSFSAWLDLLQFPWFLNKVERSLHPRITKAIVMSCLNLIKAANLIASERVFSLT